MEKLSSTSFRESEDQDSLIKQLKVVNKPYKNAYVPDLNIQGKYLETFGFNKGDMVDVLVSENRILIEKIIEKKEL
jgi:hypothetical protein